MTNEQRRILHDICLRVAARNPSSITATREWLEAEGVPDKWIHVYDGEDPRASIHLVALFTRYYRGMSRGQVTDTLMVAPEPLPELGEPMGGMIIEGVFGCIRPTGRIAYIQHGVTTPGPAGPRQFGANRGVKKRRVVGG